jgi:hypothetical protein
MFNFTKIQNEKFDITCIFSSSEKCREKSFPFISFVEYTIILKTNKKVWELKKRFNDFDELNSNLTKSNIKNLPRLPQKALFKNKDFHEDRVSKLKKYLTSLLLREDIYSIDLIFDFIELKKEEYLLMKVNIEDNDDCPDSPSSASTRCSTRCSIRKTSTKSKFAYGQNLQEETIIDNDFFYSPFKLNDSLFNENELVKTSIIEFLEELNSKSNQNKSLLIQEFRDNLFDSLRKKIPGFYYLNEDIYKLLFGDRSSKKLGLLFHCGDIKENVRGAEKCIDFLCDLLNNEYIMESESYANILKIGKLDVFKQMNLKFHLLSGRPSLFSNCCRIIGLILNEDKKISLKSLLQDETLEKQVENFLLSKM